MTFSSADYTITRLPDAIDARCARAHGHRSAGGTSGPEIAAGRSTASYQWGGGLVPAGRPRDRRFLPKANPKSDAPGDVGAQSRSHHHQLHHEGVDVMSPLAQALVINAVVLVA